MAKTLQRQLLEAYEARVKSEGLTLDELIRLAKLDCSADSLSRKLRGTQSLRAPEVEALATALRIVVQAGRAVRAA